MCNNRREIFTFRLRDVYGCVSMGNAKVGREVLIGLRLSVCDRIVFMSFDLLGSVKIRAFDVRLLCLFCHPQLHVVA